MAKTNLIKMAKAVALLILVSGSSIAARCSEPAKKLPPFFNLRTVSLFSTDALIRTADAYSTYTNLNNPCKCFKEANVPSVYKNQINGYIYSEAVVGVQIGAAYLAHKTKHYKIEHLLESVTMVDLMYDGQAVYHNLAIAK